MNFKRIEIVFVIAFIGLNLFLFALYRNNTNALATATNTPQTESIETLLSTNNITYSGDFSREKMEGYYLSGEQTSWPEALRQLREESGNTDLFTRTSTTDNVLTNQLTNPQIVNTDELADGIVAFIAQRNLVPFGTDYTYQEDLSTFSDETNTAIASQSYEGISFFDSSDPTAQLELTLTESSDNETYRIDSYRVTHISNIETLRERMELISEREAVATLYTNSRLPQDSEILWTKLAYSRIIQLREKSVYVPVWFVAVSRSGETGIQYESVNAISNSVITNSSLTVVES